MTPLDKFLVESLALTDSILTPERRYTLTSRQGLLGMADFSEDGLPLPVAGDASDRKRLERQRRKMEADGLIEIIRSGNRAVGYRLTSESDWVARALAGRPGFPQCIEVLDRLRAAVQEGRCWRSNDDRDFVNELQLAGLQEYDESGLWRKKVYADEVALLPAAFRCWTSGCVCEACPEEGGAAHTLTLGGLLAFVTPAPTGLPKRNGQSVALYEEIFQANQSPRGFTAEEIAEKLKSEKDIAQFLAYDIVRGTRRLDANSKWPRPQIMAEALAAERSQQSVAAAGADDAAGHGCDGDK